MSKLLIHQLIFALIFILAGTFALLSEKGVLPTGYLGGNPQAQYLLDVVCVVLCTAGTYLALRLMSFDKVKNALKTEAAAAYYKWDNVRLALIALCVWVEVCVYYATLQSQTAHYALMISLVAAVFCIPTARERDGLISKDDKA